MPMDGSRADAQEASRAMVPDIQALQLRILLQHRRRLASSSLVSVVSTLRGLPAIEAHRGQKQESGITGQLPSAFDNTSCMAPIPEFFQQLPDSVIRAITGNLVGVPGWCIIGESGTFHASSTGYHAANQLSWRQFRARVLYFWRKDTTGAGAWELKAMRGLLDLSTYTFPRLVNRQFARCASINWIDFTRVATIDMFCRHARDDRHHHELQLNIIFPHVLVDQEDLCADGYYRERFFEYIHYWLRNAVSNTDIAYELPESDAYSVALKRMQQTTISMAMNPKALSDAVGTNRTTSNSRPIPTRLNVNVHGLGIYRYEELSQEYIQAVREDDSNEMSFIQPGNAFDDGFEQTRSFLHLWIKELANRFRQSKELPSTVKLRYISLERYKLLKRTSSMYAFPQSKRRKL